MPYEIAIGDVLLATVEARLKGQQVLTCLCYKVTEGAPDIDGAAYLAALAEHLVSPDELVNRYQLCMSDDVKNVRVKTQKIYPVRFAYVERYAPDPNGLVAQDMMGSNTSVVVTRKGELAGPKHIGNLKLFGCPKTFTTDGEVNGTGTVAYTDFVEKLGEQITVPFRDPVISPAIFHKAAPEESVLVKTHQLQFPLRVVRRRTVGVGS